MRDARASAQCRANWPPAAGALKSQPNGSQNCKQLSSSKRQVNKAIRYANFLLLLLLPSLSRSLCVCARLVWPRLVGGPAGVKISMQVSLKPVQRPHENGDLLFVLALRRLCWWLERPGGPPLDSPLLAAPIVADCSVGPHWRFISLASPPSGQLARNPAEAKWGAEQTGSRVAGAKKIAFRPPDWSSEFGCELRALPFRRRRRRRRPMNGPGGVSGDKQAELALIPFHCGRSAQSGAERSGTNKRPANCAASSSSSSSWPHWIWKSRTSNWSGRLKPVELGKHTKTSLH